MGVFIKYAFSTVLYFSEIVPDTADLVPAGYGVGVVVTYLSSFLHCYPAFYLVLNHTAFNQIKKRHSINYSDGFYIGLLYAVPLVLS